MNFRQVCLIKSVSVDALFCFWGFIKMNILIVGNGFDLSHYLPTKYDHFMVAMEAIENWDVSKGEMNFDDLFSALYEKEDYFF